MQKIDKFRVKGIKGWFKTLPEAQYQASHTHPKQDIEVELDGYGVVAVRKYHIIKTEEQLQAFNRKPYDEDIITFGSFGTITGYYDRWETREINITQEIEQYIKDNQRRFPEENEVHEQQLDDLSQVEVYRTFHNGNINHVMFEEPYNEHRICKKSDLGNKHKMYPFGMAEKHSTLLNYINHILNSK